MKKRNPFVVAGILMVAVVTAIGVAGVFWFFFGDSIQERLNRLRFKPAAWQAAANGHSKVRIRMVDDLLQRHHFTGMAREQVTALLGEPDQTGYFKEWDLVYWLGPERGFMGIDSEWLVMRLDSQKKVTEYRIARD